jgi:hypothetical protein
MLVVYLVCSRRLEFLGTRSLALFDLGTASELLMLGIYYNRTKFPSKL